MLHGDENLNKMIYITLELSYSLKSLSLKILTTIMFVLTLPI